MDGMCLRSVRALRSGSGLPCPARARAGAVTPPSLSYIVFWSVTVLVPEVLVRLVFCCEGCRVPVLLFLVPFRGGVGPAQPRGSVPGPPGICVL